MRKFYSWFPPDYYLDLSEPDLHILRRPDGSMVTAFLPELAQRETLQRTAHKDYRKQNGNLLDPVPGIPSPAATPDESS